MKPIPPKVIQHYRRRAAAEAPRDLRRHPKAIPYTLIAAFCWQRSQEISDNQVELLVQIVYCIHINAERRVDKQLLEDFKRVDNKPHLLYQIAVPRWSILTKPSKMLFIPLPLRQP